MVVTIHMKSIAIYGRKLSGNINAMSLCRRIDDFLQITRNANFVEKDEMADAPMTSTKYYR